MLHLSVADRVHRVEEAHTNWYVVEEGDEVTVVDAGFPRSWRSLQELLGRLGRKRVAAVVLTHGHFDHVGFAERARRELGVSVFAHEREVPVTRHPTRYDHERSRLPYLLRHPGFDRNLVAMAAMGALRVDGVERVTTYVDAEQLDVPGRPRVVFTPGHTHGHCALLLGDRGVLFAGDSFVTYNPYRNSTGPQIVSGAATADSELALRSLDVLVDLDVGVVLTGHGEPWTQGTRLAVERAKAAGPS